MPSSQPLIQPKTVFQRLLDKIVIGRMIENHLFIGLGGTGGSILRYLHDRIEAEDWELQDVGFSFLYVDCINVTHAFNIY